MEKKYSLLLLIDVKQTTIVVGYYLFYVTLF